MRDQTQRGVMTSPTSVGHNNDPTRSFFLAYLSSSNELKSGSYHGNSWLNHLQRVCVHP